MRDIKERKADLKKMLDEVVDPVLLARGFTRRKGSTAYKLKLPEAVQEIVFSATYSPNYKPGTEAHIDPRFVIKMPEIYEMMSRLLGGDKWLLATTPDLVLNLPIEFAAPKGMRPMWFTYGPGDYSAIGDEICEFIKVWLYDLMDALQDPDGLIRANEASDARIIKDDKWYVKVAAAYLLRGGSDDALAVLEGRFKKPNAPKRYAVVFETLPGIATS